MNFLRKKYFQIPICVLTISVFSFSNVVHAQEAEPAIEIDPDYGDVTGTDFTSGLGTLTGIMDAFSEGSSVVSNKTHNFPGFTGYAGSALSLITPVVQMAQAKADMNALDAAFEDVGGDDLDALATSSRGYAHKVAAMAYGGVYAAHSGAQGSIAGAMVGFGAATFLGAIVLAAAKGKVSGRRMWTFGKTGLLVGLAFGAYFGAKHGKAVGEAQAKEHVDSVADRLEAALAAEREAFRQRIQRAGGIAPPAPPRSPRSGIPDQEASTEQAAPPLENEEARLSIEDQIEREELRLDILIGEQNLNGNMVSEGVALLPGESLRT